MIRRLILVVLVLLASATTARAQTLADYDYEHLSGAGLSFDVGHAWPSKVEPTERDGLRFDLGFLGPGLRITPSITYWDSKLKATELHRLATRLSRLPAIRSQGFAIRASDLGVIRWSDLSINLDGHFAWDTDLGVMTYLGGGVGIHQLNGRGDPIRGTVIEDLLRSE